MKNVAVEKSWKKLYKSAIAFEKSILIAFSNNMPWYKYFVIIPKYYVSMRGLLVVFLSFVRKETQGYDKN